MGEIEYMVVNGHKAGLVGLTQALEETALAGGDQKSDREVGRELLQRLSEHNYFAAPAHEAWEKALARRFRAHLGLEPVEEETPGLDIKVLGMGCNRCQQLTQEVYGALSRLGQAAEVEHVTEIKRIASYGAMGQPALVIDGKVVWVGSVPPANRLEQMLREALQAKPSRPEHVTKP